MADVTVNIRGNASQLRNELEDVSRSPTGGSTEGSSEPSSRPSPVLPSDRLIDEIRDELNSQRATSTKEAIEAIRNQEATKIDDRVTERYNSRRLDMQKRMSAEYDEIDKNTEEKRKEGVANLGVRANDPLYRKTLEDQLEKNREGEYKKIGQKYDKEENQINDEEKKTKSQSEEELTNAVKELTQYFNRKSNQANESFLGNLRNERAELIKKREGASTEEEASESQKQIDEIDKKLRRVTNQVDPNETNRRLKGLQIGQGVVGAIGALGQGNILGSVTSLAVASGNQKAILGFQIAQEALNLAHNIFGASEDFSQLGSLRSTVGGARGADARYKAWDTVNDSKYGGKTVADYGFYEGDFAQEAFKRSKARGTSNDWFNETLRQVGMERDLGLDEGSMTKGDKYDRYGRNTSNALADLVSTLSSVRGSGISQSDFTRVQEKYDIQQQLMNSFFTRTDKPNYDVANRELSAFSSIRGITQDTRTGGDIQQIQNSIQNPMNDRMRALIFGTISDMFPKLKGRSDLIDRAIQDPKNEGKIMSSVIARIKNMYGGTDTTMGYYAFKAIWPNITPDRRDAYVRQNRSLGRGILRRGNPDELSREGAELSTSEYTAYEKGAINKTFHAMGSGANKLQDSVLGEMLDIVNKVANGEGVFHVIVDKINPFSSSTPSTNTVKSGGKK